MKRAQILLISTYAELTMQAKKIAKELNIPIDVYEGGILNNGHIYAATKADLYDVIISISGTAETIKKMVTTVPVLSIETTSADILRALGHDTTIVGHGGCVQELAHQKGMDYVLIKPSYTAIKQTLSSAKNIIEAINKDKFQNNRLTSIIDYSLEGVISVSKNGDITCFNTAAKKIFNLEKAPKTIHDLQSPPYKYQQRSRRNHYHGTKSILLSKNRIYYTYAISC